MVPRVYTIMEAAAVLGYRSASTIRNRYLDTPEKRRELGFSYGARGQVTLLADAVDRLAERERKDRESRGPWRLKNLGGGRRRPRRPRQPDADGV